MDYSKDQWNLNVTSKGFRIRYRLHPATHLSVLRQRRLNKTAINKDEVSIRTADSFNQIRNIKVPSKGKEKGRKDEKVDKRRSCAGWRPTFLEGWLPGISLYLQNPNPRDKEPSLVFSSFQSLTLFVIFLSSCTRASLRFLISARLKNRLGRGHHESSSNNLPLKY